MLALHVDQIREFGGSEGLRDQGGLESAVAQANATYDGKYLQAGLFEMAAAYAFHIAENHPFVDGNTRAALNAAIVCAAGPDRFPEVQLTADCQPRYAVIAADPQTNQVHKFKIR